MIQFKCAFVLGAIIGTGLGILIAPEKGSETRAKLKKESKIIKNKFVEDFKEVREDVSKTMASGQEKVKEEFSEAKLKASKKADNLLSFLEKQIVNLKEINKAYQQTTSA